MKLQTSNKLGFAMVDTLMAVVMFAILIPGILWYLNIGTKTTVNSSVAQQMKSFVRPVERFTRDNYAALLAACDATNAYELPPSGLVPLYMASLPNGTTDPVYGRNPFDQRYRIFYLQPQPGILQVFILTEGGKTEEATEKSKSFVNIDIPMIAGMIGSSGGFIAGGSNPLGYTPKHFIGAFKSWKFDPTATSINSAMTLAGGHLVLNLNFDKGQLTTDFLNRYDTGDPEVNTMRTDLIMGTNSITSAKDITASGTIKGGLVTSDTDVQAAQTVRVGNGSAVLASNGNTSLTQNGSLTVQNFSGSLQTIFAKELNSADGYTVAPGGTSRLNAVSVSASNVVLEDYGNKTLASMLPNLVFKDSWYVGDGSSVAKPSCGAGQTPRIMLIGLTDPISTTPSDVAVPDGYFVYTLGKGYTTRFATDYGWYWSVSIQKAEFVHAVGVQWVSDVYGRALAHTYCAN